MMWLHEVDFHLVTGCLALGAAFGLMAATLFWRKK